MRDEHVELVLREPAVLLAQLHVRHDGGHLTVELLPALLDYREYRIHSSLAGSGNVFLYHGSDFFHHRSRVDKIPDPGSGFGSKNLIIFNPKKTVSKLSEKLSRIRIFHILDPGSRDQKSSASRIRICNTDSQ